MYALGTGYRDVGKGCYPKKKPARDKCTGYHRVSGARGISARVLIASTRICSRSHCPLHQHQQVARLQSFVLEVGRCCADARRMQAWVMQALVVHAGVVQALAVHDRVVFAWVVHARNLGVQACRVVQELLPVA